MKMERGFRTKLEEHLDITQPFQVKLRTIGPAVYDSCCFGVDAAEKLSDDRYMVFYNQTSAPGQAITCSVQGNDARYQIQLKDLPFNVTKLIFTISIDGDSTMAGINSIVIEVAQNGNTVLQLSLTGEDFQTEKSVIGIEIYLKSVWRIAAVARGFNYGLEGLLKSFGGEVAEKAPQPAEPLPAQPKPVETPPVQPQPVEPPPVQPKQVNPPPTPPQPAAPPSVQSKQVDPPPTPPQPATPPPVQSKQVDPPPAPPKPATPPPAEPEPITPPVSEEAVLTEKLMSKINLSKDKVRLEKHVVNLSKCVVDLSKKSHIDLGSTRARVVVALDYSGSMGTLYRNGTVQQTINKLVPLGLTFDDNGSIDLFLFQNDFRKMEDLNLSNYENYVREIIDESGYTMGGTYYAPVLKAIIEGASFNLGGGFFNAPKLTRIPPIVDDGDPTLILFITDGENFDHSASDAIIRRSSERNVFIQFIGIGNETFSYLKKLDDMPGRKRDNTGFSRMRDLAKADDSELYTNVLSQFANWLKGLQ